MIHVKKGTIREAIWERSFIEHIIDSNFTFLKIKMVGVAATLISRALGISSKFVVKGTVSSYNSEK